MPKIQTDVDLYPYNTFRVHARAKYFLELNDPADLPNEKALFLGGGSNILFTGDFDGLVVKNNLLGKKVIDGRIEVASGENWIETVNWAVNLGLSGIENLAYIPGTAGAAVAGNIAAYGQSLEDAVVSVKIPGQILEKADCRFEYRESIFTQNPGQFITAVTLKLSREAKFDTDYHSRYESLATVLPPPPYTPKIIAEAVTKLRQTKLPDWTKLPTAGSFFKNPNVTKEKFQELAAKIKDLQFYPANKLAYGETNLENHVKIPAGRLLDELGWKGKKIGNVGTYEKHSLIVVNYGGATGQEILDFTTQMRESVKKAYDIDLEPEVKII